MKKNLETTYLNISPEEVVRAAPADQSSRRYEHDGVHEKVWPVDAHDGKPYRGKSRYEMVDRFKRLRACRHLGVESIRVEVLEGHGRVI